MIWRAGWVLVSVAAGAAFLLFTMRDGGSVVFTVLMAWFAALAIGPAVQRLTRWMPRGVSTLVVMGGIAVFLVLFLVAFGGLLVSQVQNLVVALPTLVAQAVAWLDTALGERADVAGLFASLGVAPEQLGQSAADAIQSTLAFLGSSLASIFGLFNFALFTFYLAADGDRLRTWLASFLPPRQQTFALLVWDTTAEKTGRYVGARFTLAAINAATTAVVFYFIGMPSWLALAVWTGLVAQFVPTIGTYIAIILPVLVGLLSHDPWIGVAALVWAVIYQQVENVAIEPKISSRAVSVHPAVSFGSVLLGGALFGVAGSLLAIPVVAMLLSLVGAFRTRHVTQA